MAGLPSPLPQHPPGHCPTCGKPSAAHGPVRPFCSPRCQRVDLGRWLRGDYAVPGEPLASPLPADGDDSPDPER